MASIPEYSVSQRKSGRFDGSDRLNRGEDRQLANAQTIQSVAAEMIP